MQFFHGYKCPASCRRQRHLYHKSAKETPAVLRLNTLFPCEANMAPQLVEGDLRQKDTVIFWLALALIVVSVAFLSTIISLSVRRFLRRPSRYQKVGKQEQEQKQKS